MCWEAATTGRSVRAQLCPSTAAPQAAVAPGLPLRAQEKPWDLPGDSWAGAVLFLASVLGHQERGAARGDDPSGVQPQGPRVWCGLAAVQNGHRVLLRLHRRAGEGLGQGRGSGAPEGSPKSFLCRLCPSAAPDPGPSGWHGAAARLQGQQQLWLCWEQLPQPLARPVPPRCCGGTSAKCHSPVTNWSWTSPGKISPTKLWVPAPWTFHLAW